MSLTRVTLDRNRYTAKICGMTELLVQAPDFRDGGAETCNSHVFRFSIRIHSGSKHLPDKSEQPSRVPSAAATPIF